MSYRKGTTTKDIRFTMSDKMDGKYTTYPQLQGYTRNGNTDFVAMLKSDGSGDGVFVRASTSGSTVTQNKTGLLHANDCAYSPYDDSYYVVLGGGGTTTPAVRRYGSDLKLKA